jgi:flagellar hook-length control protein FliK
VQTELHATKVANDKKTDTKGTNKPGNDKTIIVDSKQPNEQADATTEGQHNEGAFTVTVTPEAEGETPAPKRRLETKLQSMPEAHEGALQLAESMTVNTAAKASSVSSDTTTDAAATSIKNPEIPAVSPTPTDPTAPGNHVRGQQIPGSFANRLESASAERKANDGLNGVERTRFVQRVARAFQRVGDTEGEIRLRLSPPELGAVKLEVSLRDGAMVARMETETTTARNLLMDNLPQLKERLAEQNVRIETFEVEVRDQSNRGSAEDAQEQLRQQNEQQRNRLRGERATSPVIAAPIVQTLSAARQSSQLNIVI